MKQVPQTIILRPTASADPSTTSGKVNLLGMRGYSIHALFSGSNVAGTLKLQVSSLENPVAAGDWVDLTNSSQSITASASYVYSLECQYRWVRAVWTYTSGTGNLTIVFFNNGV